MNQVLKEEVQGTATILDRTEKSDKKHWWGCTQCPKCLAAESRWSHSNGCSDSTLQSTCGLSTPQFKIQ